MKVSSSVVQAAFFSFFFFALSTACAEEALFCTCEDQSLVAVARAAAAAETAAEPEDCSNRGFEAAKVVATIVAHITACGTVFRGQIKCYQTPSKRSL